MKLAIVWRRTGDGPQRRTTEFPVRSAWAHGSWVCYRKHGSPETTHMIPESAVDEVMITQEPADPDVVRRQQAGEP